MAYIDEISGGGLLKVAIARALVQEPKVLLLDEPTNSLDMKNQVEILNAITGIVRDHRIPAIITMYDFNHALRFADTFIILRNGTVDIHGTCDIITPIIIDEVYNLPVRIGELGGVRSVIPTTWKITWENHSCTTITMNTIINTTTNTTMIILRYTDAAIIIMLPRP